MSDQDPAKYHFISWVRRGIGASVNSIPATGQNRNAISVQVSVVDQGGNTYPTQPAPIQVQLYGHGDVTGIDPRVVHKTEPSDGTPNFEPNYLCCIEFVGPDLPWMFSPSIPTGGVASNPSSNLPAGERLAPWIALIVLKQSEFNYAKLAPADSNSTARDPSRIQVQNIPALQDLSDSWNWAHVQIPGDKTLADLLASNSANVISRLICPRRLDPETSYSAFLVPAYEIGRQKGLGNDTTGIDPMAPAWNSNSTAPLDLPLFAISGGQSPRYQFDFHTSDEGDFESLVRRLKPTKDLPAGVGQRKMDVSLPGMNLPPASKTPMGLEGALAGVSQASTPWDNSERNPFQSKLQDLINQTSPVTDDPSHPNGDDPVIAAPIYGRWPAGVTKVTAGSNAWVSALNFDPRTRGAAGMGTQVIQNGRTQLLASAWQQVEGILEANQKIQQGQLARATLRQVYSNRFAAATTDSVLSLTSPVQSRVLQGSKTVRAVIRDSRVPERVLSPTFRKVTRPRRRLVSPVAPRESLLRMINDNKATIVPKPKPPEGMVSLDNVSEQREQSLHKRLLEILAAIELARRSTTSIPRRIFLTIALGLAAVGIGAAILGTEVWEELEELFAGKHAAERIRMSNFTPQQVAAVPARPGFVLTAPNSPALQGGPAGGADSAQAKAFRTATGELFSAVQSRPADPPEKPPLQLNAIRQAVLNRIDPDVTVRQRIQAMISLPRIAWQPADFLASPILAAPDFPQPMYLALRDLSPSYLLPGADQVPRDSLSLVVQNHKFIESYMVGLSHELTRQLIWENYPTFDQRGTYFRQFWDVTAYVPQGGDPTDPTALRELLKDIPLVPLWKHELGKNLNRPDLPPSNVVLLVRGELFRRYPNAIVYAVKAKRDSTGKRVRDDSDQRYPIFRGTLPADMTFLGFNLSVADAHGGTNTSPDGFFFVFQQPPSEPRFGLEPTESAASTTRWADLAWTNFATTTSTTTRKFTSMGTTIQKMAGNSPWRYASQILSTVLQSIQLPNFLSAGSKPADVGTLSDPDDQNNSWGQNSAQTAYILLRMPFRILIHADLMLPS